MSWHELGDGMHEVASEHDGNTAREIQLFNRPGDWIGVATIPPQLIEPDAIIAGDRCFVRAANGDYREVFSVAASAAEFPVRRG